MDNEVLASGLKRNSKSSWIKSTLPAKLALVCQGSALVLCLQILACLPRLRSATSPAMCSDLWPGHTTSTISLPVVSKELKELPSTESRKCSPLSTTASSTCPPGSRPLQVTQGNTSFLILGSSDLCPSFSPQETAIPSMLS